MSNASELIELKVRPGLASLLAAPDLLNPGRLWRALSSAERKEAIVALLNNEGHAQPGARAALYEEVARGRSFRLATVQSMAPERVAVHASAIELRDYGVMIDALVVWHMTARYTLLCGFLDAAGVEHENGRIAANHEPVPGAVLTHAAQAVARAFAHDEIAIYFALLRVQRDHVVGDAIATIVPTGETTSEATAVVESPVPAAPTRVEPESDEFTTLDRRLIRVAVDSVLAVDGAPTPDELDDLLGEVVQMSGSRPRSYFHMGYRDALRGATVSEPNSGLNDVRRAWYLAGFVAGLGRQDRNRPRIVEVFDQEHLAKSLLGFGGPSQISVRLLFLALCDGGRFEQAATLLTPEALFSERRLPADALEQAKLLVRNARATDAKAMLLPLVAVQTWPDLADRYGSQFWYQVRRRMAHCHRLLHEGPTARVLLQELLAEPDMPPTDRSHAIVDLGLLDAGFTRLADVRFPANPDSLDAFRVQLERGLEWFQKAEAIPRAATGHADYCLAVFDLLNGKEDDAVTRMERAVSEFNSQPDIYLIGDTLLLAKLYLAVAICRSGDAKRMPRAVALIRESAEAGLRIPPYVLSDVLGWLGAENTELAQQAMESLIALGGDALLDEATIGPQLYASVPLADHFVARLNRAGRTPEEKAADARAVLPMLRRQRRFQEAGELFALLDQSAMNGVGVEQFVELLGREEVWDGALDADEAVAARVRLLPMVGRAVEAAALLMVEARRVAAADGPCVETDLVAMLETAEALGQPDIAGELRHLVAAKARRSAEKATALHPNYQVSILVVGGDETQSQYDDAVREHLRATFPTVSVEFLHTGWTSNWGEFVLDVRRRLDRVDGIVIHRFIRTGLGRAVRELCDGKPWRLCWASGRQSIAASIIGCAAAATARLQRLSREGQ